MKPKSNYTPPDDLPTVGGSYTRAKPGAKPVLVRPPTAAAPVVAVAVDLGFGDSRHVVASPVNATKPTRK